MRAAVIEPLAKKEAAAVVPLADAKAARSSRWPMRRRQ